MIADKILNLQENEQIKYMNENETGVYMVT